MVKFLLFLVVAFTTVPETSAKELDSHEDLYVYLNSAYQRTELEKAAVSRLLAAVIQDNNRDSSYNIHIEWLNYEGAKNFLLEDAPSIAIITTGMYCSVVMTKYDTTDIRALGVVRKFDTNTYRYFVLVKKGVELSPEAVKGRMQILKKTSLSGSIFPLDYLAREHGFPRALLDDDGIRQEWATIVRRQEDLFSVRASQDGPLLLVGEGIPEDREDFERNGWDVYPRVNEKDADFEITRSLLLTRNLSQDLQDDIQSFLINPSPRRSEFLGALGIQGVDSLQPQKLQAVVDAYKSILQPPTGFDKLYRKIEAEFGLYILALVLLTVSHLVFRYKYAEVRENIIWIVLVIVIKYCVFVVFIWAIPSEARLFIPLAIIVGATDRMTLLAALRKLDLMPSLSELRMGESDSKKE